MIADLKEKYRRDQQAILDDALMDRSREIARRMKAQGDSTEKIAAATQLSKEEIEAL
jgi:hypothetical protein